MTQYAVVGIENPDIIASQFNSRQEATAEAQRERYGQIQRYEIKEYNSDQELVDYVNNRRPVYVAPDRARPISSNISEQAAVRDRLQRVGTETSSGTPVYSQNYKGGTGYYYEVTDEGLPPATPIPTPNTNLGVQGYTQRQRSYMPSGARAGYQQTPFSYVRPNPYESGIAPQETALDSVPPLHTYSPAYPQGQNYFQQRIDEGIGISALRRARNPNSPWEQIRGGGTEFGYELLAGLGGLVILGGSLIRHPLKTPKNVVTQTASSAYRFVASPSQSLLDVGQNVRLSPGRTAGKLTNLYLTGKLINTGLSYSPLKFQSATIGLEEQIALGDIPPAAFKGTALTWKGKSVFYAGYSSGEFLTKAVGSAEADPTIFDVYLGKNPPKVNIFPETDYFGNPILKLNQPISTQAQQSIFEANLEGIPNLKSETKSIYEVSQQGAEQLEFAKPVYTAKGQILERRTSSPEAVEELYQYEQTRLNQMNKNFGSSVQEANLAPEVRRIPGDTDIQLKQKGLSRFIPDVFPLNVLKQDIFESQGIQFVSDIPKAGKNLAKERVVSSTNPMLVEVSESSPIKSAIGQHAEDVHLNTEFGGYSLPKGKLFGLQAIQNPETLGGIPSQTLSEQLIAKRGSILQLRRISTPEEVVSAKKMGYSNPITGDVVLMPEAHRLKDIVDYSRVLEGLGASKQAESFRGQFPKELFIEEQTPVRGISNRVSSSRVSSSRISSLSISNTQFGNLPSSLVSNYQSKSTSISTPVSSSPSPSSSVPNPSVLFSSIPPSSPPSRSKPSRYQPSSPSIDYNPSVSIFPSPSHSPSISTPPSSPSTGYYSKIPPPPPFIFNLPDLKPAGINEGLLFPRRRSRQNFKYTASYAAVEFGLKTKGSFKELSNQRFSGIGIRGVLTPPQKTSPKSEPIPKPTKNLLAAFKQPKTSNLLNLFKNPRKGSRRR